MPLKKACEEEQNNRERLASDTSLSSTPLMNHLREFCCSYTARFCGPFKPTPKQKQKHEGEILSEFQVKRVRTSKIIVSFFRLRQK